MNREELVEAVGAAFNCAGSHIIGCDYNFDVADLRGALRALCAYAGFARTSPPHDRADTVIVDSVEAGEIVAGCSRADVVLVRRNRDGDVDREHLCEILRKYRIGHGCATRDLLGCFTVAVDGHQDLDDLAALMVDAGGCSFFDYSAAPRLAIDFDPGHTWRYDSNAPRRMWRDAGGQECSEGHKFGHAWKSAIFADLRGRVPGADVHALVALISLRKDLTRGVVWV
jgi:hypothetical protein